VCSNPLAGTDTTLLALSGTGYMGGKLFGFASCERAVGAAEGMNVLAERRVPVSEGAPLCPVTCCLRQQHLTGPCCSCGCLSSSFTLLWSKCVVSFDAARERHRRSLRAMPAMRPMPDKWTDTLVICDIGDRRPHGHGV